MFAIPGLIALLALIFIHPQDIWQRLARVPLLNYAYATAIFGFVLDLRLRLSRLYHQPLVPWALALLGWCLVTVATWHADLVATSAAFLAIPFVLFAAVAYAVQSLRGFSVLAGILLALALFFSVIAIHQRFAPTGCFGVALSQPTNKATFDGRSCEEIRDCEPGEPGFVYFCEHVGLLGTFSTGLRVRYLGFLADPNELAMVLGMSLPLAFGFFLLRRSAARLALLILTLVLVVTCDVFTQSRGGQLVFLTVIGVYFVRRYGVRGVLVGALLAAPLLLLGGRSSEEAGESSAERLELLHTAVQLFRMHPLRGVGFGLFTDYVSHTAHNSYALAAAELGFPGLFFFSGLLMLATKMTYTAMARYAGRPEAEEVVVWSGALFAAMCGLMVGIFFLSLDYSPILWTFVGACGALYAAIQRHDPEFRVQLTWSDWKRLAVFDVVFVIVTTIYTSLVSG
jgi:hypothetical protein